MKNLYHYNYEINERFIRLIEEHSASLPKRVHSLMSHILNAHSIWLARLQAGESTVGVWEEQTYDSLSPINALNYELTLLFLEGTEQDLNYIVAYRNSKGDAFESSVGDILWHILNHSTHHRAQIADELRRIAIAPPVSDYIFFRREL